MEFMDYVKSRMRNKHTKQAKNSITPARIRVRD